MPNYAIGVGLDGTATYCTTRGGGKGVGIRDSPEWRGRVGLCLGRGQSSVR